MREGDELTTTSWLALRFNPDWDGAASCYEQAGSIYKSAKHYPRAKNAYQKAALAQLRNHLPSSAARMYETAAMMAKEEKEMAEVGELLQKAARCYRENGNPEKAADVLTRAAKQLEAENPSKALDCFMEACDIYESEEKEHFSIDSFKACIGLLVRAERWEEALVMLERLSAIYEKIKQPHNICKVCLSVLLIHLHQDDFVAADRAYNNFISTKPAFAGASEARLAAELLEAYENKNPDALAACLKKQTFNFLDNHFVRMARGLTTEGGKSSTTAAEPAGGFGRRITAQAPAPTSTNPKSGPGALVSGSVAELFGRPTKAMPPPSSSPVVPDVIRAPAPQAAAPKTYLEVSLPERSAEPQTSVTSPLSQPAPAPAQAQAPAPVPAPATSAFSSFSTPSTSTYPSFSTPSAQPRSTQDSDFSTSTTTPAFYARPPSPPYSPALDLPPASSFFPSGTLATTPPSPEPPAPIVPVPLSFSIPSSASAPVVPPTSPLDNGFASVLDELPSITPKPLEPLDEDEEEEGLC